MRFTRLIGLGFVSLLLAHGGCGGEDDRAFSNNDGNNNNDDVSQEDASLPPGDGDGDLVDASLPPQGGPPDAASEADADAGPIYVADNCGGVICAGAKQCVQDAMGAYCDCDVGFIKNTADEDGNFECVLDESCMVFHPVYHGCRHNFGTDPVVATFFSLEYCGGVPVPPEAIGDPAAAFELLEDNAPIDLNESASLVVPRSAELFVTLALDVSGSVLSNSEVLSPLVARLRDFVSQLQRPVGEPPVTVSVLVFGRSVAEYVAPTVDLAAVDAALEDIETDQSRVTSIVQTNGTALFDAVQRGIEQTERLIVMRDLVSQGGVLGSGTLVVVTDGNNESGVVTLNAGLVSSTPVHVVSVGINEAIDDRELGAIGRDGSFLAPNPDDWQVTFDNIAERIQDRISSIYRVAYCSPSTQATHTLTVMLAGQPMGPELGCGFDAGNFVEQPPLPPGSGLPPPDSFASCKAFLESFCDYIIDPNDSVRQCWGSVMACGHECLPGECCTGEALCASPTADSVCHGQDELCRPGNERCVETMQKDGDDETIWYCEPTTPVGGNCDEVGCEEGTGQCIEALGVDDAGAPVAACAAVTRTPGEVCYLQGEDDPEHQCTSLNCAKDPDQNDDTAYCRAPARMFDWCSGASAAAVCELGTTCKGTCVPRTYNVACSVDSDCLSGNCYKAGHTCRPDSTCHFSWADKVTQ